MEIDKPKSIEIPSDWVKCLVISDIESLQDCPWTKAHAVFVDTGIAQLGEARILKSEIADIESFEKGITDFVQRNSVARVDWMNEQQSQKDDYEKPARDAEIKRKLDEFIAQLKEWKDAEHWAGIGE